MKVDQRPFRTSFYLWNGVAALFFSACVTEPHSHNTLQLFIDLQDGFKCKLGGGSWETHRLLLLRENVIHQLDTNGSVQLLIYLDADSTLAKQLKITYLAGKDAASPDLELLAMLHPVDLQRALLETDSLLMWGLISRIFSLLIGALPASGTDPRIEKIRALIAAGDPAVLSIYQLAEVVCLSESHLRALFKHNAGVSIYKYLLWAKLRCGINGLMAGKTVGEAALAAGFSDSSHFHKMLVQMFGLGPGAFLKNNRVMQMVSCDETPLHFETRQYDRRGQVVATYR
jgi:AraC-like DNA-binding protein